MISKAFFSCLIALSAPIFSVSFASANDYAEPGPYRVESIKAEWRDDARQRNVPAKIYLPQNAAPDGSFKPAPVIIFSHGLGGSRDGYEYLGRHWASHGFICIHLQHLGSDDAVWKGQANPMQALRASVANPQNAINRPKDISFAVDEILKENAGTEGPLHGRIDPDRIGAGGHSFGAYTVLAVAGQSSAAFTARDERIKAAVAMSAPVVNGARNVAFDPIHIPIFHYTGTRDEVPALGGGSPEERRIPFDRISGVSQFLVIFQGGDHMVFSGRGSQPNDAAMLTAVRSGTTAFWDAFLRADEQARTWLTGTEGFKSSLGQLGSYELKTAAP